MATASNSKLLRVITKASPRGATDFADAITAAIVVAGTAAKSFPGWQRRCGTSWTSGPNSLVKSKKLLMLTLLPRS